VLLSTITLSTLVLLAYLFINSFTYAIIGRIVLGICSGVIPIGKAVLIEILPIEKAPSAIALTTALWYLGNFFGPFIGSLSYNWMIFPAYKYFTPTLIIFILSAASIAITYYYFEETLVKGHRHNNFSYRIVTTEGALIPSPMNFSERRRSLILDSKYDFDPLSIEGYKEDKIIEN